MVVSASMSVVIVGSEGVFLTLSSKYKRGCTRYVYHMNRKSAVGRSSGDRSKSIAAVTLVKNSQPLTSFRLACSHRYPGFEAMMCSDQEDSPAVFISDARSFEFRLLGCEDIFSELGEAC